MVISLILSYFVAVQGLPLVAAQHQEDTQFGLARRESLESSPSNIPPVSVLATKSAAVDLATTRTADRLITVTFVAGTRNNRLPTVIVGIPQATPSPSPNLPVAPAPSSSAPAPSQTTSSRAITSQETPQPTPTVKPVETLPSQPTTEPEVRPPNLPPTEPRVNEGGSPVVGEKSAEGESKKGESAQGESKQGESKPGETAEKSSAEAGALNEGEKGEGGKEGEKKEEPNNIVFNVAGAGGFAAIVAAGIGFMKYKSRREKLTQN
ncbi:hypothetical protein SpCBS45565_g01436 [Spizellomyces sp. 'palustris']|nr:hypothetical protein SpCBS45565_g01436 [Spizellomyces sp. 'palustris']